MNQFILSNVDSLRQLIPDYIDVLALFISNINEVYPVLINSFIETHSSSGDSPVQALRNADWQEFVSKSVEFLRNFSSEPVWDYHPSESYWGEGEVPGVKQCWPCLATTTASESKAEAEHWGGWQYSKAKFIFIVATRFTLQSGCLLYQMHRPVAPHQHCLRDSREVLRLPIPSRKQIIHC